MLGAIVGDIVGSIYEWNNIKTKDFPLFQDRCFFTDDTVMTCAVAEAVMNGGQREDFIRAMKKYGRMYPDSDFGGYCGDCGKPINDDPAKCKRRVKEHIEKAYGYDLSRTLDEIRPTYQFNETCQETVPQAIIAFLESTDFEDAIRNAISLGGDSDTLAAITGSIAEAAYGIPEWIREKAISYLDEPLRAVLQRWERYIDPQS